MIFLFKKKLVGIILCTGITSGFVFNSHLIIFVYMYLHFIVYIQLLYELNIISLTQYFDF